MIGMNFKHIDRIIRNSPVNTPYCIYFNNVDDLENIWRWLYNNTTGNIINVDGLGHRWSFEFSDDAVKFKLTWG